jgi:hypothetical protein
VHAAHVDMQIAAHDLSQGNTEGALARIDRAIPVVGRAENAARYGFGPEAQVRARAAEIAALARRGSRS